MSEQDHAAQQPDQEMAAEGTQAPVQGEHEAPVATDADPVTEGAGAGSATPQPGPRPIPRPAPKPGPRPVPPRTPGPRPGQTAPPVAPLPPPVDPAGEAEAATWGRVDADGTVWVREAAGERVVGQYAGADTSQALDLYVRRFLDLTAKVSVFEARLKATDLPVKEIDSTLAKLTEELKEPAAVGDLDSLRARLESLRSVAEERRREIQRERAAAKERALALRTEIVEEAERIAAQDPEKMQWRPAGEQLRALLERWKEAQRQGPRLERATEDALWKRFSHARTTFDRERRHFFAQLDQRNQAAKAAKERLVARAEELSTSTDWRGTAAAYRELMAEWKAAGRASRKDDDALWARFRAAQDVFFAARDAAQAQAEAEFEENLKVKLALLEEAEALLPVTDLDSARARLRDIQDRWEQAGKVPRARVQQVEGRLRAVEQAVRAAEQERWRRSNPETRARAEGAAAQLEASIAALEQELEEARAAGDRRRVEETENALTARRSWLEQVRRAAEESEG